MCIASAGEVLEVDAARGEATVDTDGRLVHVSLAPLVLDGRHVSAGDWVLVHTGFAVAVIPEAEARQLLDAVRVTTHAGGPPA